METIDLCALDFFQSGNIYTGSRGDYRYRVQPKDGTLFAAYYYTFCYEKADPIVTAEFPLDESGFAQMRDWLTQHAND